MHAQSLMDVMALPATATEGLAYDKETRPPEWGGLVFKNCPVTCKPDSVRPVARS